MKEAPIRSGQMPLTQVKLDDIKEMARLFPGDLRIEETDRCDSFLKCTSSEGTPGLLKRKNMT